MRIAKTIMYVSVTLLCLVGLLGMRATRAQGQTPSGFDAVGFGYVGSTFVVIGRTVYQMDPSGNLNERPPIPGTSRVIAIGGDYESLILEDGSVYRNNGTRWQFVGAFPNGGAVGISRHTLGQLKQRYR